MIAAMTTTHAENQAPNRRARLRAAMVDDIKAIARRQLTEQGPGAVSLRGIAREIGIASSALFRYFPSHNDLITALVVDAYDSLAGAMRAGQDAVDPADHAGRWYAICLAYRRWSLENQSEFALLHGTPIPGYHAPPEATGPAAGRFAAVALGCFAAAVEAGAADPERTQVPAGLKLGQRWNDLLRGPIGDYQPRIAGIVLNAWASLQGYLRAEVLGNLSILIDDTDSLCRAHIRTIMLGMGFNPALVDAAVR
jgi:AcrR family transcriptional regulator